MGEEEVLGAEQADAGRARPSVAAWAVGDVVDVGQQLDLRAVGADRGLVAVEDEPVLEVEELALHLAIGGCRFAVGADEDEAVAAVDDHQVAGADLVGDADDAGDGGDAPASRQDRRVAGAAAGLGDDAGDRQASQAHRLAREDLVGDQDDGSRPSQLGRRRPGGSSGLIARCEPIREITSRTSAMPLAEVFVLDLGERGRVSLEDDLKRRERGQLLGLDQRADLGEHRLVVDDLEMALEDLGLGRAELLGDLRDDRFQLGGRQPQPHARTARSRRAPAEGSARDCGSLAPNTESTRYATPTTTPGLTAIPLCMACRVSRALGVSRAWERRERPPVRHLWRLMLRCRACFPASAPGVAS